MMTQGEAPEAAERLTGRQARCGCGGLVDSREDLPFFEFRGEGSLSAKMTCRHCGYHKVAHDKVPRGRFICAEFEPRGAWEHDTFYCGCRGWD